MAHRLKRSICVIAAPVLARVPLFIRLCSAFVDNLTLILRTALVVGAIFLVKDLRIATEKITPTVAEIEQAPVVHVVVTEPTAEPEPQDPVLSEQVQHFLNCTYEDYRTTYYDDCVEGQSRIYLRPQAGPDDTGYVPCAAPVMLARLNDDIKSKC